MHHARWATIALLPLLAACSRTPAVPTQPQLPNQVTLADAPGSNNTPPADTPPAATPPAAETRPPATEPARPAAPATDPPPSEPAPPAPAADSAGGVPSSDTVVTPPHSTGTPEAKSPAGENADVPFERIILLASAGPVVLDVKLQLRGERVDAALSRLVEEAFRIADEDGDGRAKWSDVARNPRFQSGQFGNLVADTDEERAQLIRIYDVDNDGEVDREELPRFLTRNAGGGKSFSLRSSNEYRGQNRRNSPTRLLLDANRDGAITSDEMDAGPARLLARDADDDESLVLAELKESPDELDMQPQMMPDRRRVSEPDTAIWLSDQAAHREKRWGMVQFQLQELYSYRDPIHAGDWPMTPQLFQLLDEDRNGELTRAEIARLDDVPPHLVVEVSFDSSPADRRGPVLRLRPINSELSAWKPRIIEESRHIVIQLPQATFELLVHEDPALTNLADTVQAQFAAADRNRNGYLEQDEVPESVPGLDASFAALDGDGDGKVYPADLLAYAEQRVLVTGSQVRARAVDQEDALFGSLDADSDRRLNAREIRQLAARLRQVDPNGDGQIQVHEIPDSMVIAFVRGNPQQDNQLFAASIRTASPGSPAERESLPRWFRGMDANGDGELSPREFFGSAAAFQQLDADRDGYVTVAEAVLAEQQTGTPK